MTKPAVITPQELTKVRVEPTLVHQVVVAELANIRAAHGHTKTRGEVRGGGKKPWRQKGTGRARHGSSRSPIWIGGGITFGPRPNRNFAKRTPVTMRQRALQMVLATKYQDQALHVVDNWPDISQTKQAVAWLKTLPERGKNLLLILSAPEPGVILAFQNIPQCRLALAQSVRLTDLLKADTLLLTNAGLAGLLDRAFPKEQPRASLPTTNEVNPVKGRQTKPAVSNGAPHPSEEAIK